MMGVQESTELETTAEEARELAQTRADLEAFKQALLTGELEVEVDPQAVMRRIVAEIIDAPDVEAAFAPTRVISARDAVGFSFELRGLVIHGSSFGGPTGVFASVEAVDLATGERVILNTSAAKQLAKLYVIERDQRWPVRVRVVQAPRPTESGYFPLDFELLADEQPA